MRIVRVEKGVAEVAVSGTSNITFTIDEEDVERVIAHGKICGWYYRDGKIFDGNGYSLGRFILQVQGKFKVYHLDKDGTNACKHNVSLRKNARIHPINIRRLSPDRVIIVHDSFELLVERVVLKFMFSYMQDVETRVNMALHDRKVLKEEFLELRRKLGMLLNQEVQDLGGIEQQLHEELDIAKEYVSGGSEASIRGYSKELARVLQEEIRNNKQKLLIEFLEHRQKTNKQL